MYKQTTRVCHPTLSYQEPSFIVILPPTGSFKNRRSYLIQSTSSNKFLNIYTHPSDKVWSSVMTIIPQWRCSRHYVIFEPTGCTVWARHCHWFEVWPASCHKKPQRAEYLPTYRDHIHGNGDANLGILSSSTMTKRHLVSIRISYFLCTSFSFWIRCTIATRKGIFLQGLWWRNAQTTARSHSFEDCQLISMVYQSIDIVYLINSITLY